MLGYLGKAKAPPPPDQTLVALQQAIDSIGTQGASQVTYTAKGAGGSTRKFVITPALPVEPVAVTPTFVAAPTPAPAPGLFDFRNPDGTLNTTKIAVVGAVGLAVVFGATALMRGRRR